MINMFEEFESLINDVFSDDYWYDVALFSCQEIINGFSDSEWNHLSQNLDGYSEKVKVRVAECLADIDNINSLSVIIKLSNTDSRELFIACIDSLRDMDLSSVSDKGKSDIIKKADAFSFGASVIEKAVINAFVNKIK